MNTLPYWTKAHTALKLTTLQEIFRDYCATYGIKMSLTPDACRDMLAMDYGQFRTRAEVWVAMRNNIGYGA